MSLSRTDRSPRWVRSRALLAALLVLGWGTALTAAAWTDSEFVSGTATAGVFSIEGSVDRQTFAEHASGSPATLSVVPDLGPLVPGNSAFMTYTVRIAAGSTYGAADMRMATSAPAAGGLVPRLSYSVRTIAAGEACNAATFDASVPPERVIVANFTPLSYDVPANATRIAMGETLTYCVRVTLFHETELEDLNKTATPYWQFSGVSR